MSTNMVSTRVPRPTTLHCQGDAADALLLGDPRRTAAVTGVATGRSFVTVILLPVLLARVLQPHGAAARGAVGGGGNLLRLRLSGGQ